MTGSASAATAIITFARPPARHRDRLATYRIDVDGNEVAQLWPGEEIDVPVTAEAHVVRARIDWTGSPKLRIELGSGERITLCVEPAGGRLPLWRMIGSTHYLRLTHQS